MGLHCIHFLCNLSATVSFDCPFELTGFEEELFFQNVIKERTDPVQDENGPYFHSK
jgi:hypothetical protein